MPCGHTKIPSMPEAIDSVADALRDQAAPRPVTRGQMLTMRLPAQHGCSFADDTFADDTRDRLDGGELEGPTGGFISVADVLITDLDDDGVDDGLAHLVCSSGASGTTSALVLRRSTATEPVDLPYTTDAETALPDLSVYRVQQMTADSGQLIIDAYGLRPGDSGANPSAQVQLRYDLGSSGPQFSAADDLPPDPSGGVVATAEGFGPVRLGMTASEAFQAAGDQFVGTAELASCSGLVYKAGAGEAAAYVPIDEAVVTSITTPEGTRTDRGIGSGDTLVELEEAYGEDHTTGVVETQAGSAAYVTTGSATQAENGTAPGLIGFPVNGIALGAPTVGGIPGFEYCSR